MIWNLRATKIVAGVQTGCRIKKVPRAAHCSILWHP